MNTLRHSPLSDLLDVKALDELFHHFHLLTGLHVGLMDVEGHCVYASDKRIAQRCRLCKLVQSTSEGAERCREEFARGGQEAFRWGEPYYFECWMGLMEWSVALVINDEYAGSIVCGQVLVEGQNQTFRKHLKELCEEVGTSWIRAEKASDEIQVISPEKMRASGEMLALIAQQICGSGEALLEARRRQQEQQRRIAETIHERKIQGLGAVYPLDLEKQLIAHVRLGEVEQAKALLNHLLGAIFFRDMGSGEVLKARLIELLAQLSRAAVEAGADLTATLGANLDYLNRINACRTQDEMCETLRHALDRFTEGVYASRNTEQMRILAEAIQFARDHYSESISLNDVAHAMHRNSSTLRKLFREQMGTTFTEYLNKVRVEASVESLKNPALSLAQIAVDMGFYDQSHFGKVFRVLTGYTPANYRRKVL
ncbi:MAG: PocR ligand-binding domain-containing protein [Candidatus Sumerlaeota bacterium]|nr:PocR ligand-binding domain-containing protein [Candidatus Sumerlaeota bacterium]